MIADEIKNKILSHIEEHCSEEEVSIASSKFQIEIPDSHEKGDLTCNIALILGNITKSNPKEIGLEIGNILKELNLVSSIEVAGPGFINIFLNHSGTLKIIKDILDKNTIKEEEDSKKNSSRICLSKSNWSSSCWSWKRSYLWRCNIKTA